LFCHIELVFHEPTYTRLGGDGASLYLLVVVQGRGDLADCRKSRSRQNTLGTLHNGADIKMLRMLKKAVQQGRSE
jgi:hypothetical protein